MLDPILKSIMGYVEDVETKQSWDHIRVFKAPQRLALLCSLNTERNGWNTASWWLTDLMSFRHFIDSFIFCKMSQRRVFPFRSVSWQTGINTCCLCVSPSAFQQYACLSDMTLPKALDLELKGDIEDCLIDIGKNNVMGVLLLFRFVCSAFYHFFSCTRSTSGMF